MRTSAGFGLWVALCCSAVLAQEQPPTIQQSPLATLKNGRAAANNNRIVTTGIRSPPLASSHALIISVSAYPRSPLPGVLKDRVTATELAERFGVPSENIVRLSEKDVTREGVQRALDRLEKQVMPGDKLYIYFSGHGARLLDKSTGQCTESLVMQDLTTLGKDEFADMVKPLSAKADKTVVMLDACHAGGVAELATTRDINSALHRPRPKFDAAVSSAVCGNPTNLRSFSGMRGIELETTENNLVVLAAARKSEVAWDTDDGGAMTYAFLQCVRGQAVDKNRSGSVSMQELTECVQSRLDTDEDQGIRQHLTLSGNGDLVPGFTEDGPSPAPQPPPGPGPGPGPVPPESMRVNTLAALNDIYGQRDDRWSVQVSLGQPVLKIGSDFLDFNIVSQHDGFLYVFYLGTGPESFYLLFPNKLDPENRIKAGEPVRLPRPSWTINALGPAGTDHVLVMVTQTPRNLGDYSLPEQYVSLAGPFGKIQTTAASAAHLNEVATLSKSFRSPECATTSGRDPETAQRCSNVFGAALVSVEER
jgi:Caspase domain/Domain of unknown function (DUF4384)